MYYYFYYYSHSAAPNLQVSSQTASSVLESVTGHSDWEFLKPDRQSSASSTSSGASASHSSSSSETTLTKDVRKPRHPMLEDFDGEIAVFQVNGHFSIIICIYYYFYNVLLAIINARYSFSSFHLLQHFIMQHLTFTPSSNEGHVQSIDFCTCTCNYAIIKSIGFFFLISHKN